MSLLASLCALSIFGMQTAEPPPPSAERPESGRPTYWKLYGPAYEQREPPTEEQLEAQGYRIERRWYGELILAADATAALGVAIGAAADSGEIAGLSLLGFYVIAPMAVHAMHRRGGAAAGSAGLRIGAPIAGVLLLTSDCEGFCIDEFVAGFLVGATLAIGIDVAVLAWERVPVRPSIHVASNSALFGLEGEL
jgi:hypothetical protein